MATTVDLSKDQLRSPDYQLSINGAEVFVYHCESASFAVATVTDSASICIEPTFTFQQVVIRPLFVGITATNIRNNSICFSCDVPIKLSVEFDGNLTNPLFLFLHHPEACKPSPDDPTVRYYHGGHVYEEGQIVLTDGQTLYIEEDAVVYGTIFASDSSNIAVRGRGILSGQRLPRLDVFTAKPARLIEFLNSSSIEIYDLVLFDGPSWHLNLVHCNNVVVQGVSIISQRMTGDGIDILGCTSVSVSNCFARTNDDCISIKGCDYQYSEGCNNVDHVRIENSIFWNASCGNALEIGFETRCDYISNIVFSNCDIIHCQYEGYESGGAFTIHNGDRAVVSNVLYENIRIENCEQKLIDFKVLYSGYSKDENRGFIKNIRVRNIQILDGKLPPSIIRGFHPGHLIEDILIENLSVNGARATDLHDAKLVIELARNVRFT